jgi:DNA-binding NarL/FixJ family response regulator
VKELRALIVEDDRSWQAILAEILTDSGLEVDVVSSTADAVAALRLRPHRIAVIDLSLAGSDHHNQDGLTVLQALRQFDPGCVGILLTGFATVELAVSALSTYGAFTCLRKEVFQRSEFRKILDQALTAQPLSLSSAPVSHRFAGRLPGDEPEYEGKDLHGTALVVEDDAGWRNILSELLVEAGFQVRACSSFGEALGCLRRGRYELAVVDLSLAGSAGQVPAFWNESASERDPDGYRLLISTRAGAIPTVVVSGLSDPDGIERTYSEHGIFAYLQKQFFNRSTFVQTAIDALSAGQDHPELGHLTGREKEVLELLAKGFTNREIAEALVISTNTVKRHLKAIFDKLAIHTRSAAAAKAVSIGVAAERSDLEPGS